MASRLDDLDVATPTDDDTSQYLEDPALYHDILPQPYRRVNKILDEILDFAWCIMAEREAKLMHEASRKRPPQYDTASIFEELGSVSCLAASPDGKYVAVCKADAGGLVIIDAAHKIIVAEWMPDKAGSAINFTYVDVFTITEHIYGICTIGSSGAVHLFLHIVNQILEAWAFFDSEENRKVSISHCIVSNFADFIGLVVQPVTDHSNDITTTSGSLVTAASWLEVYRLPKESWVKELDPFLQLVPTISSISNLERLSASCAQTAGSTLAAAATPVPLLHGGISPRDEDANSAAPDRLIPTIKFASPTMVVKVRPQSKPTAVAQSISAVQALKAVETGSHGQLIGTGQCHPITKQHLDLRMSAFEQQHLQHSALLHSKLVDNLISAQPAMKPSFHFLSSTKWTPKSQHVESTAGPAPTTSVAVWWTGCSHILHYNLSRSTKDIEANWADLVWPMSHVIVATAAAVLFPLFVVGLDNNAIIVWDRNIGVCVRVIKLNDVGKIRNMFFCDKSVFSCGMETIDVAMKKLLVEMTSGQIYTVSCCEQETTVPRPVYVEVESDAEVPATVRLVPGMPQLLAVCQQDGRLYIHDIVKCQLLCELVKPIFNTASITVCMPLKPSSFATADGGRVLYAIVDERASATETDVIQQQPESVPMQPSVSEHLHAITTCRNSELFVYKLFYFPTFDNYYFPPVSAPAVVTSPVGRMTLHQRVSHAFHSRVSDQLARTERLQQRWLELKSVTQQQKVNLDNHVVSSAAVQLKA